MRESIVIGMGMGMILGLATAWTFAGERGTSTVPTAIGTHITIDANRPATQPSADLERLWKSLAEKEYYANAHLAVKELVDRGEESVQFLRASMGPKASSDPNAIRQQILRLGSTKYSARSEAFAQLRDAGRQAVPALREALSTTQSAEIRQRIGQLLDELTDVQTDSPESRQARRAIWAIEKIGSPSAREFLKLLDKDPHSACVAYQAGLALRRMGVVPASSPTTANASRFTEEMALAEKTQDSRQRIEHWRNALASRPGHPQNIILEFKIATELSQGQYPGDSKQQRMGRILQATAILQGIVDRYNHMDYYTKEMVTSSYSPEMMVPTAAILLAGHQSNIWGDPVRARENLYRAMEWIEETRQRRMHDWKNEPEPIKTPFDLGPMAEGKSNYRENLRRQRQQKAAEGRVLGPLELSLAKVAVTDFGLTFGRQKADDVTRVMGYIIRDFPGSPLSEIAQEHINRARKLAGKDDLDHSRLPQATAATQPATRPAASSR